MSWQRALLLGSVSSLLSTAIWARTPLTICYEDVTLRPWSMPEGKGLSLDLLRSVEAKLGESFVLVSKPWKRCQAELKVGNVDAALGMAHTAERRNFAVFPMLANGGVDRTAALFEDDFHVFALSTSALEWNGSTFHNLNGPVAVQAGYVVEGRLRAMGITVISEDKSVQDGLRMVENGTMAAAILQGHESVLLATGNERFKRTVRRLPQPFSHEAFYLPFSRQRYANEAKRIRRIWATIAELRKSAAYQQKEADALKAAR
ncbi:substrate-binding periplasmic protein [Parachitinimonas caeni]|uniref:Transporter substrate-binding domain-containing protein n=1 Tax=Parachitinimonas caeni TaxID=3031301 RepID=A0ABT7DYY2_9NEIS|nr:transporter substrate-binding domain-containing protein [Parachitinimonas caeni]MDK2125268.1 transporter substrate-binding domain-containing protein [Parachitinimonas caeni]